MAYTKYSLTPDNNNAAPPDGAPEGMLPSGVNNTMRDMMAQIRDVGDGIRDGTYAITNANITGGAISGLTSLGVASTSFSAATGVTEWVYSNKSVSVTAQETTPSGVFFKPDGLKMYVLGTTGDDVNEYTLSTAWDVSTATYTNVSATLTQDTLPNDLSFSPDGTTLFILGLTNDTVYQYSLSTAWDVTTISYASKSFSVTTQENAPTGMWMKPDGTTMYIIGTTNDTVYQYTLGTAWDVSTASYASISYGFTAQEPTPVAIALSNDGTKMYIIGSNGDDIWEYTLGTAWDISTATPVNNVYVGFEENGVAGLFVDSTGDNRVYVVGTTADRVFQYNTSTNAISVDTQKFYITGELYTDSNIVTTGNAYVDGAFTVLGASTFTGSMTVGTITTTGTATIANSTATQTIAIGTGATVSGSTKTINIGTAGVSGSTTAITLGSSVAGSTTTVTANGTWTFANPISATNGGTGQSTYTVGDLLVGGATNTLTKLAGVATGNALISGGVGAAPSYGKIGLTTHVSGTLPVANGGTGITSFGAGVATWLGTPSSANLASAVTDETGSGSLVFATTPTITAMRQTRVAVAASDINLNSGSYFTRTISGTTTLTVSNVPASGTAVSFILDLTNGGSATVNWWSNVKWAGGTAPTLTSSGRDVLGFYTHDGGTNWNGLLLARDIK